MLLIQAAVTRKEVGNPKALYASFSAMSTLITLQTLPECSPYIIYTILGLVGLVSPRSATGSLPSTDLQGAIVDQRLPWYLPTGTTFSWLINPDREVWGEPHSARVSQNALTTLGT